MHIRFMVAICMMIYYNVQYSTGEKLLPLLWSNVDAVVILPLLAKLQLSVLNDGRLAACISP